MDRRDVEPDCGLFCGLRRLQKGGSLTEAQPTLAELLYDARLTDTARIIGVHVAATASQEEPVAIPYDEFAGILHGAPSGDTIARHVRLLEVHGYVTKSPGGRGSPVFEWCGSRSTPDICGLKAELYTAEIRAKALHRTGADQQSEFADHTGSLPGTHADQSLRSSSRTKKDEDEEEDAGARDVKLPHAIEALLETYDELFTGCRGSLRSYLTQSVPKSRQVGYVQTLAGWRNGLDQTPWRTPDGSHVPPDEQSGLLATAFNELLGQDEGSMKNSIGDIRNLRTKLHIRIQQSYERPPKAGGQRGPTGFDAEKFDQDMDNALKRQTGL